jgi:uncharacterized protein (DUF2249 family)
MNIFLIILLVIGGIFVVTFAVGMIAAAFSNSGKRQRVSSLTAKLRIPENLRAKLVDIFHEYKNGEVESVNKLVNDLDPSSLNILLAMAKPENRPAHLSSGSLGDETFRLVMEKTLTEKGYSSNATEAIIGILFYDLDKIL